MNKVSITLLFLLFTVNLIANNEVSANYPGKNIIGKGYNIFGEFANTNF